ncbi:hypothetical protein H4R34_001062 [Dimargaris verticillata]|uniref:Uncharacterized protein n=1 Tax=Dimargaris verticillata TaxID=2761393 RepID=A0A9W8EFB7_9FUNG|nr:hypothetical protein H4R34_001062 [Dimargaris verticillata]
MDTNWCPRCDRRTNGSLFCSELCKYQDENDIPPYFSNPHYAQIAAASNPDYKLPPKPKPYALHDNEMNRRLDGLSLPNIHQLELDKLKNPSASGSS